MKTCPRCLHEFRFDVDRMICGYCGNILNYKKYTAWRLKYKNADTRREYRKQLRLKNIERERIRDKQYHLKKKNRINFLARQRRIKNLVYERERDRLYWAKKRASDPVFRLHGVISSRLRESMKRKGLSKSKTLAKYGIDPLKIYTKVGPRPDIRYHLDHIVPLSAFDLSDERQITEAFSPENLQWLKGIENIRKSNRWVDSDGVERKGQIVVIL